MSGLLVSVRSGEEAAAALRGGAELIDVKEPDRGALGAASPRVWREVCQTVNGQCPVSAALGELSRDDPGRWLGQLAPLQLAKIGLAGCRDQRDWRARWRRLLRRLPRSVAAVAVVYADHEPSAAPHPEQVIRGAAQLGCSTLLIDTFDKSRGGLFDVMPHDRVQQVVREARRVAMTVVLGGSLNEQTVGRALELEPDLVAVRSAVCRGSRSGPIDEGRVRALAQQVSNRRAAS